MSAEPRVIGERYGAQLRESFFVQEGSHLRWRHETGGGSPFPYYLYSERRVIQMVFFAVFVLIYAVNVVMESCFDGGSFPPMIACQCSGSAMLPAIPAKAVCLFDYILQPILRLSPAERRQIWGACR